MYADKTAVTIQSKKIVLNEIKDSWALLESYEKSKQTFWPTQYFPHTCPKEFKDLSDIAKTKCTLLI